MFKIGDYVKVVTKKYGNIWYNRVGIVTKIYESNTIGYKFYRRNNIIIKRRIEVTFIDKIGAFLPKEIKKATKREYFLDVL